MMENGAPRTVDRKSSHVSPAVEKEAILCSILASPS